MQIELLERTQARTRSDYTGNMAGWYNPKLYIAYQQSDVCYKISASQNHWVLKSKCKELVETPPPPDTLYPYYAQIKNHCEWTKDLGLPIQSYLEYTNPKKTWEQLPNGLPAVGQLVQTSKQKPVVMTKAIQQWAFQILWNYAPEDFTRADVVKVWRNLYEGMKAFTNKTGWDNGYRDWIQELNLNKEDMKLQPAISHGATVKVKRAPFNMYGLLTVEIECMDAFDPSIFSKNPRTHPHLFFPAVNWNKSPAPHGHGEPFPKMEERDQFIPLLGNHTTSCYMPLSWVRFLKPDTAIPVNPYWQGF